jgi:hypothetical protein
LIPAHARLDIETNLGITEFNIFHYIKNNSESNLRVRLKCVTAILFLF